MDEPADEVPVDEAAALAAPSVVALATAAACAGRTRGLREAFGRTSAIGFADSLEAGSADRVRFAAASPAFTTTRFFADWLRVGFDSSCDASTEAAAVADPGAAVILRALLAAAAAAAAFAVGSSFDAAPLALGIGAAEANGAFARSTAAPAGDFASSAASTRLILDATAADDFERSTSGGGDFDAETFDDRDFEAGVEEAEAEAAAGLGGAAGELDRCLEGAAFACAACVVRRERKLARIESRAATPRSTAVEAGDAADAERVAAGEEAEADGATPVPVAAAAAVASCSLRCFTFFALSIASTMDGTSAHHSVRNSGDSSAHCPPNPGWTTSTPEAGTAVKAIIVGASLALSAGHSTECSTPGAVG